MRVFVTKVFARFSRKEMISDDMLCRAVRDAESKPNVDLGGGVIKQRVARSHQGKSGGYRTIILYRKGKLAFFVYGFAKSDLGNISRFQLLGFKKLAPFFLDATNAEIDTMIRAGEIAEVKCNDER